MEASRTELDRIAGGAPHQGLVLQVPAYDYAHPDDLLAAAAEADEPALLVALDGVTDPRNLGAVLRSAAAFGAHGVVVPSRRAAGVTATAWKVSAGAAARVPVARATNLTRALEAYQKAGCTVVGLDGGGRRPTWPTSTCCPTPWCSSWGRRARGSRGWSGRPATWSPASRSGRPPSR